MGFESARTAPMRLRKPYGALLKARVCFAGSPSIGISIHNQIDDKTRHFQGTRGNSRIQAGSG
jgi:hypothetical protein